MKRYIKSTDESLPHYSDLFDRIDAVVIVSDIDTPYDKYHINVAVTSADIPNFSSFSKRRLAQLAKTRPELVKKITDYRALVNLMDLVSDFGLEYDFTSTQRTILEESFAGRSLFDTLDPHPDSATIPVTLPISMYDIDRILHMIRNCRVVTKPDLRTDATKNFADCHDYIMEEADYLGIIRDIKGSEVITKARSYDLRDADYYMNYIFEFIHPGNDYQLISGQVVEECIAIYIKLVFDYAKDKVIAVVSFHDPKPRKGIPTPAFPNYDTLNRDVKSIANRVVHAMNDYYADTVSDGNIKLTFRLNNCGVDDSDTSIFIEVLDPFDDKVFTSLEISSEYSIPEHSDYYVTTLCNNLVADYESLLK